MNRVWFLFALMGTVLGLVAPAWCGQQTDHAVMQTTLQAMIDNASAAQSNAAIYQWRRVNLEVDRIAADEQKREKLLQADGTHPQREETLRQAISELRAARLDRNIMRIGQAARKVIDICRELIKT